jgi:2-polyprenyl-3-methyl-5-hydroxy-6-metoxy-1,4-benzoquinol methylase
MTATHRSYHPTYFATLHAIEDRHFCFRTRNKVVATLVAQMTGGLATCCRVLEIGCGGGDLLRVLEQACPRGVVVGMDLVMDGLQYARRRTSCLLLQGDVHNAPFGTQFDLIGLFDVLEHLADDVQVLRNLHAMLRLRECCY